MQCPRCGRTHSGICGIPGVGVKIGTGGVGIRRTNSQIDPDAYPIRNVPLRRRKMGATRVVLEEMLDWGHKEQQRCLDMLKKLPHEMPEYTQLLGKYDKLTTVIHQLKVQLAARER
jgi:hypothetical protein